LAFFETVCKILIDLIFLAVLNIEENSTFKAYFGEICAKHAIFYEMLTLNLVILTIF